jgi:hypothetical protein
LVFFAAVLLWRELRLVKDLWLGISNSKASWSSSVLASWCDAGRLVRDFLVKLLWKKMKSGEVGTSSFNKHCCSLLHFGDLQLSLLLSAGLGGVGEKDWCSATTGVGRW